MSKKQLVSDDAPIINEEINEFSSLLNAPKVEESTKAPKHKSEEMTRFNVYLKKSSLEKLKIKAVKEHRKIKDMLADAIEQYLSNNK